jgi:hypothetical protein
MSTTGLQHKWGRALALVSALSVAVAVVPALAQSVVTYHGDADRAGLFVVPAMTWERARGLRLDTGFQGGFSGNLYAQPLYWQPRDDLCLYHHALAR